MPEIPHFTQGQYGKLTVEVLNDIIDHAYSQVQTSPPGVPSSGLFPIFVVLGDLITEADKEPPDDKGNGGDEGDGEGDRDDWEPRYGGYKWTEVSFDMKTRQWIEAIHARKYSPIVRNAAYVLGINYIEGAMPNYNGRHAMLFPANDKNGHSMLVFESPTGATTSSMLTGTVVTTSGTDCALSPSLRYIVQLTQIDEYDVLGNPIFSGLGIEVDAVNLLEFTGSDLGGSINGGDPNCTIDTSPTPIPVGTNVLVTRIGADKDHTPLYGFVIPNDLCVECCDEGGLAATGQTQMIPAVRAPNDILSAMLVD